jgi:hypothetical protein
VDDQQISRITIEVAQQRGNRLARLIHESRRNRQDGSDVTDSSLAYLGTDRSPGALELRSRPARQRSDNIRAKIVPRPGVALPGVAQPNNNWVPGVGSS